MIRLVVLIGIVQSILFLGHWFFYKTLIRFFEPSNPSVVLILRIIMVLLSISFVAASLLGFSSSRFLVRLFYTGSAAWVGILYLLILASALGWMLQGVGKIFHVPFDRTILLGALIAVAFVFAAYGFIHAAATQITRIGVEIPGLPARWKGKRAVWISDLHLGHVRNEAFSRKIANMVGDLRPDILFIGGDLFDGVAGERDRVIQPFSRISVPYGTYFITGNHEEFSDKTPYLEAVRRAGIRILDNERVEIEGLQIIGVDYRDSRSGEGLKRILARTGMDRLHPSILLMHSPHQVQVAKQEGISLQLSGHTHHGQVLFFRFITSRVYNGYDYGLKRENDFLIHTSSGVGTWGPPMRIDTKPEIVLIEFK